MMKKMNLIIPIRPIPPKTMFNFHAFFLGFWTTFAVLTAATYIFIYCSDSMLKTVYKTFDDINDRIDKYYGAVVEKLPYNGPLIDV